MAFGWGAEETKRETKQKCLVFFVLSTLHIEIGNNSVRIKEPKDSWMAETSTTHDKIQVPFFQID